MRFSTLRLFTDIPTDGAELGAVLIMQRKASIFREQQAVLDTVHIVRLPLQPNVGRSAEWERATILQVEVIQTATSQPVAAYTHIFGHS